MIPTDLHGLIERLYMLLPLWLSLTFHEWAHARAAWRLGDDTAALMGRMTLNPLAHIDPIGTLLLPLMGVPFGWAKPVPVNPYRFNRRWRMSTGMMWTAIAGPLANLFLVAVCMALLAVMVCFHPLHGAAAEGMDRLLQTMIFLNVILATFNLLPIPPLDGSRVADALMPGALRPAWEGFCQMGPLALAAVIVLPQLYGFNLFGWPVFAVDQATTWIIHLFGR
jgi:Zn-dependent protease